MARLTYNNNNNRTAAPKPTTAALCSDQLQRFVLLAHIFEAAGLTPEDVKTCMAKYVGGLSPEKTNFLLFNLPKVEEIKKTGPLSDIGIANLSDGNMSVEDVTRVAQQAKLRFIESPESGHGEKGWLRELLHTLAGKAKQGKQAEAKAWFNSPDCAIWLAIMARVQLVLSASQWGSQLPVAVRDAYRDGWLGVFGVQVSAPAKATVSWDGVFKLKSPKKRSSKPAAGAAASPSFLTREFFAFQTENPLYLSLIKEIPSMVKKPANELREQLSLPQIPLAKPRASNSKAKKPKAKRPKAQKPQVQKAQAQQPQSQTGNSETQTETIKQECHNTWPELAPKPQAQQPQAQTVNSKLQAKKGKQEVSWVAFDWAE